MRVLAVIDMERELSGPVRGYFEACGYSVRCEVGYIDIMATRDDEVIAVELKKSLNLELILQAVDRQKAVDSVYIAIPLKERRDKKNRWKKLCHLLRRLEIGLLLVGNDKSVIREIEAVPFDRVRSIKKGEKKKSLLIKEFTERQSDYNTGGVKGVKLMTAYREKALYIACCLEIMGPMKPSEIKKKGADKLKTPDILYKNHYGWFMRLGKGDYCITEKAREDLIAYKELSEIFRKRIFEIIEQGD